MQEPQANEELLPIILVSDNCFSTLNRFVVIHGGMGHEHANGVREEFLARGNAQGHELGESGQTDG